jgi:hypothetical protein
MTAFRTVVTLLALGGLAACGSGGGKSASSSSAAHTSAVETTVRQPATSVSSAKPAPDPCTVVSHNEAQQLTGTPLDPAVAVQATCTYTGPTSGPLAQVEVFVGDGAKKFLDIDRDLGHPFTTLTGIGDEAYEEENAVFLHAHGVWVSVHLVLLNDPAANRAGLEALARTVATRV